jgi:heat shock protein HslJ
MSRLIVLFSIWSVFTMATCEKSSNGNESEHILGDWRLTGVFLSDAKDTPCGWEVNDPVDITLSFTVDKSEQLVASGRSVINNYSLRNPVFTYDEKAQKGTVKIEGIITTEKGGAPLLIQCETRYFDRLGNAVEYTIDETGKLLIGQLKKPGSNPRDGGTYLIFEKM